MILTLLDDGHKLIGFQLTAIDLVRWQALVAASDLEGPALRDWLLANKDDGSPLSGDQRRRLSDRLTRLRSLDAHPMLIRPIEFELGRSTFLRQLALRHDPDLATYKRLLPSFAHRDQLSISRRAFESLLWTLVPPLRREKSAIKLPDWVVRDREVTADEQAAVLGASVGFRSLAGATRIDGLDDSLGLVRHVPNVASPEQLPELQKVFDGQLPSDLASLLPEWRCTFPGAYHEIIKRFAMTQEGVIDPRLQTFEQKLARDADWYFADAMADMHRATAKIRAFRLRAARRGWTVVTTDSVWA